MDYVKRRLEKARQQRIGEKIEAAMTRHSLSQSATGGENAPGSAAEKCCSTSRKAALLLSGMAIGVAITVIAWWVKSGDSGIEFLSQDIDLLYERVGLMSENINSLEEKLAHLLVLLQAPGEIEITRESAARQGVPDPAGDRPVNDSNGAEADVHAPVTAVREETLTPTHSVAAKLNLRPSASLDTPPLGVLPAGTRVAKISDNGDWYYVNAGTHGSGWCYSAYLSPLPLDPEPISPVNPGSLN